MREFLHNLLDVRSGLSGGLLENVYKLVFLIAAIPWVLCTVLAFQRSNEIWGLAWALVLGPAIYVVLVTGMRLALGFFVILLRLMEQLIELPNAVDRLTAQVGELRGDIGALPDVVEDLTGQLERAQFWRSAARRRRRASGEPG